MTNYKDITILIKTHDRLESLNNLLKSIFKYYPQIKVIIADDSKKSSKDIILNKYQEYDIDFYELEYDVGVSAGRNFMLDKTTTKYFVLCDDDFEFDQKTDLINAQKILKKNNLDILGGFIRNYKIIHSFFDRIIAFGQKIFKYELPTNYIGTIKEKDKIVYFDYKIHEFPQYTKTDIVLNFFLGKTAVIKEKNRWDDQLKLQEHSAFFLKAKRNNLNIAFTNQLSVQHHPLKLKNYKKQRNRDYSKYIFELYDINKIVSTYDDPKRNSEKER